MMQSPPQILLVEDNAADVRFIRELFRATTGLPCVMEEAATLTEGLSRLARGGIDVILLDLGLPESQGLDTLRRVRASDPDIPTIVLTGLADDALGSQAVQQGAQDYLIKGQVDAQLLARSISYAIERERARRQLQESESRYRTLFQQSPDGILIISPDTYLPLEFNDAACSQLGYSREEFSRLTIFDYQCGDTGDELRAVFSRQIPKIPRSFETRFRTRAGQMLDVQINVGLFVWNGETAFQFVIRDVTEQKWLLQERQQYETRFQQLQNYESLAKFAGGVAHDLNNILTGILGYSDLALLMLPPGSAARDDIQRIIAAAHSAGTLGREMLAYSGKGRFVTQSLNLPNVVRQLSPMISAALPKGSEVRFDLTPEPPGFDGDLPQISQAILNLVTNSSESFGSAPGVVTIRTGVMACDRTFLDEGQTSLDLPEGRYVFVEVADNGCGIPAEVKKRIFDPFFSTKFAGRGLGLPVVLGTMRGHRGTVKVASEPGHGTSVKLFFPISNAMKRVMCQVTTGSGHTDRGRAPRKILIIEDDQGVQLSGQRILEGVGYSILVAGDGYQGVETFKEHAPSVDLIILDLTMPRMDGEEAFRELRKIRKDIQVVLTSGYSEKEATQHFHQGDLAGFLPKPYTPNELVALMCKVLG
jgi:two-component system, cell cycle sensor histidine kinase and response regulator CckA